MYPTAFYFQFNKSLEFEKITRGFNRLMLQGKVHQAVRLISNANKGGVLSLDALLINECDVKNMLRMMSLLRIADAETKDRDIFGRALDYRYFMMCDTHRSTRYDSG